MQVTGIGSRYDNYIYNVKTNRFSTKDGGKDEFVDYCNGDVKGEDTERLNHFDAHTRYQFQRMMYVANNCFGTGAFGTDSDEIEVSAEIESATKTQFYVNGKKSFTAYTGMSYLPSEILTFSTIDQPYKTMSSTPYDPFANSIGIGVGKKFDIGNGYSVTVMGDGSVRGDGFGKGSPEDDYRANMMVGALDALMHVADQQRFASATDDYTDYIMELLSSQGVDTSKEFVVNGTHFEMRYGKIREVGNDYVVPSSIQEAAIKRYEEKMSEPLKNGEWYGKVYQILREKYNLKV